MLPFIFEDARHGAAKRVSDKMSIAMLIAIEFVWHKLIDAFHWILAALMLYAYVLLFYTNALLSFTLFTTERGLVAIAELAAAAVCIFMFATFVLLMALYVASAVLRLLPAPAPAGGEDAEKADDKGVRGLLVKSWGYVCRTIGWVRATFDWRSSGRHWKTSLVLILSLALFFHHWQAVKASQTAQTALRARDFMPPRVMQDSRQVNDFLRPYIDAAATTGYDYVKPWINKPTGGH
jgi:hypothetical protein